MSSDVSEVSRAVMDFCLEIGTLRGENAALRRQVELAATAANKEKPPCEHIFRVFNYTVMCDKCGAVFNRQ